MSNWRARLAFLATIALTILANAVTADRPLMAGRVVLVVAEVFGGDLRFGIRE